ncbi:sporulation membrane protein YtrI [Gracilibacillus marinus]|jgi:hypothetical protein|uniref:Sporulation membrane protein YtrI n=1 Tax=Gracilibacillus marinus TaxID=630535 RepID=A0ABV8VX60_9BACI
MHIPPLYKKPSWQRFLTGVALGSFIGYLLFLFMFGQMQEDWIEENLDLRKQLQELNQNYETLLENHRVLDEKANDAMEIKEIEITFTNLKILKIDTDRILIHQLDDSIRQEANQLLGKHMDEVESNLDLLIRAIENKTIAVEPYKFQANVTRVLISEKLLLAIELEKAT